jgi:hypothetical protein
MTTPKSATEFHASRLFVSWLAEQRVSLAFTTYQAGKLFSLDSTARASWRSSIARWRG